MIRGQTVGRGSGSKCDRRKVRLLAIKRRPADESNNFRAQDNPSHTAMATSPANASAIKYAVMSFSLELDQRCGMIACAIISGANPISIKWKPRADVDLGHAACRRVRACRPMKVDSRFPPETARCPPGDFGPERFGRQPAYDAQAMRGRMWRRDVRAAARFEKSN
jgi:hypothetical protein